MVFLSSKKLNKTLFDIRLLLKQVVLPLCLLMAPDVCAFDHYTPTMADPMLEEWRYAYYPELDGQGLRSIASMPNSSEYWFGLDSGVVSYDGYNWTRYSEKDGLDTSPVQQVFIDQSENVYAATSLGLYLYDDGRWENLFAPSGSLNLQFHSIKQLTSGTIVCGTNIGAIFLKENEKFILSNQSKWEPLSNVLLDFQFVQIPAELLIDGDFYQISDIFEINRGQLWLATTFNSGDETGEIIMLAETEILDKNIENYNQLSTFYNLQLGHDQKIFRASNGDIWIINKSNKLPALRFTNNRWHEVAYGNQFGDDEYSENILETQNNKIWISGIGNLYSMDTNGTWTKYNSQKVNIPQGHILMHSGNQSDLWIYGNQSSVYRVDLSYDKWLTYLDLNYQCEQIDGTQWFLDFNGHAVVKKGEEWSSISPRHGLIDHPVSLFVDSRNIVWAIGSHDEVASAGYFENNKWTNFRFDSLSWSVDFRAIHESRDGSIWLGGSTDPYRNLGQTGGVVQITDPYSDQRQFTHHKAGENGLNQSNAYGIAESANGNIWLGGSALTFYDGRQWNYLQAPDFNDFVNEINNDEEGTLYVGSRQHGVYLFKNDSWRQFTVQNGLVSNNIISMAVSKNGTKKLYLATDKDYSFFDGKTWINDVFPKELILSYEGGTILFNNKNQLWISRSLREWKRRVYTGNPPGKQVREKFATHRFIRNESPPETAIEVYSETVDKSGNTTIFWSGRHFFNKVSAEKLFFSYKIDDGEWSVFNKKLNHTFTGLGSGNHTFMVRAMDTEGNIDPTPASIGFVVTPPVWKQAWFILLITTFVVIVAYFQFQLIKKRRILEVLNNSLQTANRELEARNLEVQTQKDSLEEMVKKIDELSKAKLRFFTNITHEFRTPLSLILGPIEKLSSDAPKDTALHNFYGLIRKNALRLQKLINQLLELRRIESGTLELKLNKSDIVKFARDIKNLFNNQALDRDIRFTFQSDFDKLTIFFDQDKIEKILFNLLSNAFKHTPKNGKINVSVLQAHKDQNYEQSSFIKLVVEDNGTGLDEKILGNLFERFTVGHNEVEDQARESSGIGLSYIKELVEYHQGKIEATSQVGKGTMFTVVLPDNLQPENMDRALAEDQSYNPRFSIDASILSSESERIGTGGVEGKKENSPTILLVEDNDDMRYFVNSLLATDYNILMATNGEEGLQILEKEYVDLIVSDIMMPKIDGITFCHQVKSNPVISHIPVILLTAVTFENKKISGYESGADSYIVKPFKPELLKARITNLLSSREQLKQHFSDDLRFKPKDIKVTSVDEEFLDKLASMMEENISDSQFDVSKMCEMANMSHMHFIRKVKQLTGKKPIDLLKSFRLTRAKQLLEQDKINVSEIGYMVGYDLPNSFTRAFKNEFGVSPTKFLSKKNTEAN